MNEKTKDININIYEGNKMLKIKKHLAVITINDIYQIGDIEYLIKFEVDANSKLIVYIKFKSMSHNKEESSSSLEENCH